MRNKKIAFVAALLLFMFILPIPETIALRNVLMLGIFGCLAYFWCVNQIKKEINGPTKLFLLLISLMTIWILTHALLIAGNPEIVWREIWSQWVPVLFAAVIGILGCNYLQYQGVGNREIMSVILGGFLIQSLFSIIITTPEFFFTGGYPQGKTNWTAGKLEVSYWNNLALAFVAVDLLGRALFGQRLTLYRTGALWVALLLLIASNLLFGARNGVIGAALLLFSILVLLIPLSEKTDRRKFILLTLIVILLLASVIGFGYTTDTRWQVFLETAQIAWKINESDAWYNSASTYPVLLNGGVVDPSAYLRVAWIRSGLEWIKENPLGWGFSRNAFGHAMLQLYPGSWIGHSHSGWVDLGVGVGVPGLFFWFCFSAGLIFIGARNYLKHRDSIALVLFFVVAGFNGRMVLDSVNKDHMIVVFFLVLGFLVPLMARTQSHK